MDSDMGLSGISRAYRGTWPLAVLLAVLLALLASQPAAAVTKKPRQSGATTGEVYRWVDNEGVVHFGDQVPAEYAPIDRQVLNQYGVPLRTE